MAEVRVSELPPVAGNPNTGDLYIVVRAGVTSKQTLAQLKNALGISLSELGAASSGNNEDIISLTGLTTALTLSQGGTGAKNPADARANLGIRNLAARYIEGLELEWGATSVTVKPGAAFIAGANISLESQNPIVLNLTGLTAGTFYHIYYFAGTGNVASCEISTAAPVAADTGGYVKTGDAAKRYLGSVLGLTATTVHRFKQNGNKMYYNASGMTAAPFAVLPSGAATVGTDVSVSGVAPVTAVSVIANILNTDTSVTARIGNADLGVLTGSANIRQTVRLNSCAEYDILLSAAKTFSYVFDATPTGTLSIRLNAYTFKR